MYDIADISESYDWFSIDFKISTIIPVNPLSFVKLYNFDSITYYLPNKKTNLLTNTSNLSAKLVSDPIYYSMID